MQPIALHPENPHYFLFRGKPTILITSAEHYGAVVNLDFNYKTYLAELQRWGFNLTRIFAGAHYEPPGAFGITHNTLSPAPGRFICPWARGDTPGFAGGGNRFDLSRWDEAYFTRLKDFLTEASQRGIAVEFVFFCPLYNDAMWRFNPMHPDNHVNGAGRVNRLKPLTLDNDGLLPFQEAMIRKIVRELKDFDNLYYEVCNEPYWSGPTAAWQRRMIEVIADAEQQANAHHLIAQNIANGSALVDGANPRISIFNYHYANPDAAAGNYDLNRALGDDETGFKGIDPRPYRQEAWQFLLTGGAVFNHLDYSYAVGHEDGSLALSAGQPGGGGPVLRRQIQILRDFLYRFDFLKLRPAHHLLRKAEGIDETVWTLADPGQAYAAYLAGGAAATLTYDVPPGQYRADWLNPRSGEIDLTQSLNHPGGDLQLHCPAYEEDIALALRAEFP